MPSDDPYRYTDPATTQLPATGAGYPSRTAGWVEDPSWPSGWRYVRDLTAAGHATELLPVVPLGRVDFQGAVDWAWPPDEDVPGEDDELVEPTWNGLRPDDEELTQPPQDPDWRADADG